MRGRVSRQDPKPLLEIIDWQREQDLREVSQSEPVLLEWLRVFKVKEGQGVLFSNRAETRFRMVAILSGMPVLVIFPVGESRQLRRQLYLKIAQWAIQTFGMKNWLAHDLGTIEVSMAA